MLLLLLLPLLLATLMVRTRTVFSFLKGDLTPL
jgi:hypothetical protein